MTYQQAVDWCVNNVPMATFDNFDDWYEQCESELATEELTNSDRFRAMMQSEWDNFMPSEREQDIIAEEQEESEELEESSKEPITYHVAIERETRLPPSGNAPIILAPIREERRKGAPVRVEPPAPQPVAPLPPAPPKPTEPPAPKKENRFSRFFSNLAKRFRR